MRVYAYSLPEGRVSIEWPTKRFEISAEAEAGRSALYLHVTDAVRMSGWGFDVPLLGWLVRRWVRHERSARR